ncbi:unnamed protein product [Brassica oleracea]|uniref:(rape) hypothetical protein n=1 Tax=Brassica napus TaxID=3708 RepID=A0A816JZR2_BRANA|nr:unnamed protein product [Brassica napus]
MEMKLGPLGFYSYGKTKWEETCRDPISHIFVTYDSYVVNSIQFGYVENGALVLSKKHGSEGPEDSTRIVRLNHETEFVTGVSGEWSYDFITSLTFHTNEKVHEAFRSNSVSEEEVNRREFYSGIHDRCEFGGFFGTSNVSRLLSIGFYTKPVLRGVNTMRREIIVSYDDSGVRSIQFGYINNGALSMSKTFGPSPVGYSSRIVKLKHESEFVTGLSAETCNGYITSLTFHTNLRKHEVVHLTFDSKFQKPQKIELRSGILKRCEFGGFFGSFDSLRLISIGFHLCCNGFEKIKKR